ncbi:MAG: Cytochrome c4 precursor [Pseudomonadota bacterium]
MLLLPCTAALAQTAPRLEACATCHGANGVSVNPAYPSLAGQPAQFLAIQLVVIREGLREIPLMKGSLDGLNDEQLTALARHFAAQPPPPPAAGPVNAERFQRGQALARSALCGTCHLPDYRGREQMPRLAQQQEVFLYETMKSFRDHPGRGRDTIMAAAVFGMKDEQLADLAHFFAHFK